jgi:hypothetical protein
MWPGKRGKTLGAGLELPAGGRVDVVVGQRVHEPEEAPSKSYGLTILQLLGKLACSALSWRTTLKP